MQIQQESAEGTSENDVLYAIKNVSMNLGVITPGNFEQACQLIYVPLYSCTLNCSAALLMLELYAMKVAVVDYAWTSRATVFPVVAWLLPSSEPTLVPSTLDYEGSSGQYFFPLRKRYLGMVYSYQYLGMEPGSPRAHTE